MDRKQFGTMALMTAAAILIAGVAVIALQGADTPRFTPSRAEAVRICGEILQMRIEGKDSDARRRALRAALKGIPDNDLNRALLAFADADLARVIAEPAETPFGRGLRGWALVELGHKPEAAAELKKALAEAPADWEFRGLFQSALARARQ